VQICITCKREIKCDERVKEFKTGQRCWPCQKELKAAQAARRRERDPIEFAENLRKRQKKYQQSAKSRQWRQANRLKYKMSEREYSKLYYQKNKERRDAYTKLWRESHPDAIKQHRHKSHGKRWQKPLVRFAKSISGALRRSLSNKVNGTFTLLGYSKEQLQSHLIPFLGEMCSVCNQQKLTLSNSHIDHIIAMFNAKSDADVIKLNQLANLRLICWRCNLVKGNR